jgi:hypothetical protein
MKGRFSFLSELAPLRGDGELASWPSMLLIDTNDQ